MEDALIEDTFQLIRQHDFTNDGEEALRLSRLIAHRSTKIGQLSGYAVALLSNEGLHSGEWLVVTLEEEQARIIQNLLLTTGPGMVTTITTVMTEIQHFIHPEEDPEAVVALLLDDGEGA